MNDKFDVIVIGAGHAGIEAGLASARLGAKTAVLTLSLDAVGNMPCNPSIGGTAKGCIVYEIDALGGEMPRAADACAIQSRMLNLASGAAVHSLRMQCDRARYREYMKTALEQCENLFLIQDEAVDIIVENGAVAGVRTRLATLFARAVVIATGTYLKGKIHIGETHYDSGPDNTNAASELSASLARMGIPLLRFKTGTPARAHKRSIDLSKLTIQYGDEQTAAFSLCDPPVKNREVCYIAYTNESTHAVIRENLRRSPLFSGEIEGAGPRYCPSIEDKVVRFADRDRHQIFVEPCGESTQEMYLQGLSTSLPLDVQQQLYRTIEGFEEIELMRPAYAIEYDCCDPLSLYPSLETKAVRGLYGAGQFNGTSGYEEAAAQGLIAGINAARQVFGKPPVVLSRDSSYIGTLIDDLVTKGVRDPYRMMTARSEYRLLLRQDNADRRLCPFGIETGLLDDCRRRKYETDKKLLEAELMRLQKAKLKPSDSLNEILKERGGAPIERAVTADSLLRRPRVSYEDIAPFDKSPAPPHIAKKAETEIKYEGYLKRQQAAVERQRRQDCIPLSPDLPYKSVRGISLEAAEKLSAIKPQSIGQAARVSGVNPSDIAVILIYLKKEGAADA